MHDSPLSAAPAHQFVPKTVARVLEVDTSIRPKETTLLSVGLIRMDAVRRRAAPAQLASMRMIASPVAVVRDIEAEHAKLAMENHALKDLIAKKL